MMTSTYHLNDLMFAPLACANSKDHAAIIIAVCDDLLTEIKKQPWFDQVCAINVGRSADVTYRWRRELSAEFKQGVMTALSACIAVARAHNNTSHGPIASLSMYAPRSHRWSYRGRHTWHEDFQYRLQEQGRGCHSAR